MRFLIIGLGSIGERYVRNLRSLGFGDIGVVRRAPRPPRTVRESDFVTYSDLQQALVTCPDAVIIANPTALHIPVTLAAVKAGAHLLIEIPLASSLEGVAELEAEVAKLGCVTLMGHNLRFHPCIVKMKEVVQSGGIGDPLFARAEFGEYLASLHTWEDYRERYEARKDLGGGVVLTSIHEIDYLDWMLGPAAEVAALVGSSSGLEIDVEDTAAILMRHRNGAISEVHLDFVQPAYSRGCKIVGTHGAVRWDFGANQVELCDRQSTAWRPILQVQEFDFNTTYLDELKHFVNCIRGAESPLNDLTQGIHILRVGLAALRSAETRSFIKVG